MEAKNSTLSDQVGRISPRSLGVARVFWVVWHDAVSREGRRGLLNLLLWKIRTVSI